MSDNTIRPSYAQYPTLTQNPINSSAANNAAALKALGSQALNSSANTSGAGPVDKNDAAQQALDWSYLQGREIAMLKDRSNVSTMPSIAQSKSGKLGQVRAGSTKDLKAAVEAKFKGAAPAKLKTLDAEANRRLEVWKKVYMPDNKLSDKGNTDEQLQVEKARVYAVALDNDGALEQAADVATAAELNRRIGAANSGYPAQDRKAIYADDPRYDMTPAQLAATLKPASVAAPAAHAAPAKSVTKADRDEALNW